MGKNNKARRAAKAKSRARQRAGRTNARPDTATDSGWEPFWASPYDRARALWQITANDRLASDPAWRRGAQALAQLDPQTVDRAAADALVELVGLLWARGWQPGELARQPLVAAAVAAVTRLVELAVVADHTERRAPSMDPRWSAQVARLEPITSDVSPGWVARWRGREGLTRDEGIGGVLSALGVLAGLPVLEELIPPPGVTGRRTSGSETAASSNPTLQRVRRLLAKAESTEFEAEATALTAKAQELMTRHAIDQAMLSEPETAPDEPALIRIAVDAPYADVKSLLLQIVAGATRCRSVFSPQVAMSTVAGDATDLAAVELLFTSLLVQSQHALRAAARNAPPGARTRSQSYRSAFLLAFTHRIGERLADANEQVFAEAEADSGRFLPVLRARADALGEFMAERFGDMYASQVRGGYDLAGWASGRIAGDAAQLAGGEIPAYSGDHPRF